MHEVKVNWGASVDVKKKMVGLGIIVRDFEGEILVALCARYNHLVTPSACSS